MKKFANFCIFLFFLWIHAYFRGILWRIREFSERFFPFFWGISEELWKFLGRIRGFSGCFGGIVWSFGDNFFGVWRESWNFLQEFELLWWVLISFWCFIDSFRGFFELLEIIFSVTGAKVGILGVDLNFKGEFLGNLNWKLDFFAGIWTLGAGVLFF